MNLTEYLEKHGASRRLSEKTGISPPEISRLRSGKKKITFQIAAFIEFGTDGVIKMEDLLNDDRHMEIIKFLRQNVSQPQIA